MALIETQREQAAYDTGFENGEDYWTALAIDHLTQRLEEELQTAIATQDWRTAWLKTSLIRYLENL